MCDYSLHQVATRQAQVADELVTTKFANSITRGFTAVGQPEVAVCLLPGTEVAFERDVECEPSFGIGILPTKKTRTAPRALPADRSAQFDHASRRAGVSQRAGRAVDAAVRGPTRDRSAIAGVGAARRRCGSRAARSRAGDDIPV